MQFTVIKYYGKQNRRCGYCSKSKSSHEHGMHAYILDSKDYQDLIDRGWRRSGEYCYKPNNKITCCPCYTIRSDTTEFKLSKSQKKILKRMNKFLRDGIKDKNNSNITSTETNKNDEKSQELLTTNSDECGVSGVSIQSEHEAPNIPIRSINLNEIKRGNEENSTNVTSTDKPNEDPFSSNSLPLESVSNFQKDVQDTRPPCKKAKHIRMERRQAKLLAKGLTEEVINTQSKTKQNNQEKSLNDYINDVSESDRHKLKVMLVPSHRGVTIEVFNLYCKYQLSIHDDQPHRLTKAQFERFLVKSPLKLKLVAVRSEEFKATLNESYGLFEKYQMTIHNMPPEGMEDYIHFLETSPIKRTEIYGSFHQQYWLDDKLIAVGVIDILPNCVSSVYFFYDPDYSFLTLGTYGSLREIDFTHQLSKKFSSLKYYYMGFYIHSCPKMRYKGKITPSFLLCPETYSWTLLTDEIRQNLDNEKYQRFNRDPNGCDADDFSESDLDEVLVLINGNSYITYRQYIQSFNIETLDNMLDMIRSRIYEEITGDDGDRNTILEYGKLVGKSCAHRMLYEQS